MTEFWATVVVVFFGIVLLGVVCTCLFYGLRYFLLPPIRPNVFKTPR